MAAPLSIASVFETLLPPAVSRPELGRQHFERALAISNERNLIVKVMLADQYGQLMFDQAARPPFE